MNLFEKISPPPGIWCWWTDRRKKYENLARLCGGLTIGYKASLHAIELLNLEFSDDEQVVCIAENDTCGIDGIQVMLGCSIGKGNLLFRMRGKQDFSFYNRKTGKSIISFKEGKTRRN